MEALYFIMERMLDLEYKYGAFIQLLSVVKMSYELYEEQKNMKMLVQQFTIAN